MLGRYLTYEQAYTLQMLLECREAILDRGVLSGLEQDGFVQREKALWEVTETGKEALRFNKESFSPMNTNTMGETSGY